MIEHPVTDLSVCEQFWDEKARTSRGDVLGAVCLDSAEENSCIDHVQRALARSAMHQVMRMRRPNGAAVLDYGCGTGRWVDFLRGHGYRYTGVDLSAGLLTIAQRRHPNTELRKVDGQSVPYGDAQFDVIWSIAVVHHNPPDRQDRILAEFSRVIRDGGVLVLLEGIGRNSEAGLYFGEAVRRRAAAMNTRISRPAASDTRSLSPRTPAWIRFAARLDGMLCPHLAGLLPPPLHRRAIMVFEKATGHRGAA